MLNAYNLVQLNTIASPTVLGFTDKSTLNDGHYTHSKQIHIINNSKEERAYYIYSCNATTIQESLNANANSDANANQYRQHYASLGFHPSKIPLKPNEQAEV
jgi:hypothetical protein